MRPVLLSQSGASSGFVDADASAGGETLAAVAVAVEPDAR